MAWADITNGEAGGDVRTKLNALGASNDLKAPLASPTFTGTATFSSVINYGGVALAASVTGTGSMVLSVAPTITGTTTLSTGSMASALLRAGGAITLNNPTNTNAGSIKCPTGGTVGLYNGGAISVLWDNSNRLTISAGVLSKAAYTVATLPTPATGDEARVTNALAPVFGSTVVGGGVVNVPVFYDGANWIVG